MACNILSGIGASKGIALEQIIWVQPKVTTIAPTKAQNPAAERALCNNGPRLAKEGNPLLPSRVF